ncbi:hypothetical protein [Candidatus Skiveiella danica]|uniref:hypothetical protein n=1 Tax=Candidatus Skiveiella danica TaxID=3386177 RepID=UPI0039B87317
MHEVNQSPPERMTPEQRRCEIASILARGLARLRMSPAVPPANNSAEREISLAFCAHQSVHSDPVNNRQTES